MRELLKFVVYSVIGAVIFLAIYSFWFNPPITDNYKDVKDAFSGNKITGSVINTKTQPDISITSCLNEIEQKSRIAKEKSLVSLDIDIREYEKFNNTEKAITYLESWDYNVNSFIFPELKSSNGKIEHEDIVIVLIRFEASSGGESFGLLVPIVCINGKITENSKRHFNVF